MDITQGMAWWIFWLVFVAPAMPIAETATPVFSCDFESNVRPPCGIREEKNEDDFDWTVRSGATGTRDTGPTRDHTLGSQGDDSGQYIYIEVSGRAPGAYATFYTPEFSLPGPYCLTMWRNMYGHHIGRLTIYAETAAGTEEITYWEDEEQTNDWYFAMVALGAATRRVRITAVHGGTVAGQPHGDIAIDDIRITVGACIVTTTTSTTPPTTTQTTTQAETTVVETTTELTTEEMTTTIPTTSTTTTSPTTVAETTTQEREMTTLATTVAEEVTSLATTMAALPVTTAEGEPSTTGDADATSSTTTLSTPSSTVASSSVVTSRPTTPKTTLSTTGASPTGGIKEKSSSGPFDTTWVLALVATLAVGFLLIIIILTVMVCRRRRRRTKDRAASSGASESSEGNNKQLSRTTETTVVGSRLGSAKEPIYNSIYSDLDSIPPTRAPNGPLPSPPATSPIVPPLPPSRPLPSHPSSHSLSSQRDPGPPSELAPIPPMKNPLAGMDFAPMDDDPPSDTEWRDESGPSRHHKRHRQHRQRSRDDEQPQRRHRHRRRHQDEDEPPVQTRGNRQTLDAPLPPDYLPMTIGPMPTHADPAFNGYYRAEPAYPQQAPPPYDGNVGVAPDWNWSTIPRPRVLYY